jgi:hypothetical protein
MKWSVFALFVFFFLVNLQNAHALNISSYQMTFDLLPDGRANETIAIAFGEPANSSSLSYIAVGEISGLTVTDGERNLEFSLVKSGNENEVRFMVPEGTNRLAINFLATDLVFAKDNVYGFFTNLNLPGADAVTVKAILPKGFAVYRGVVYPSGEKIGSDGERIYLEWDTSGPGEMAVSFKFYATHSDYSLLAFSATAVAAALALIVIVVHYRKKAGKEFVRGFSEDERKVLAILSKEKTCMQNRIEKELKFSRAKMTRIVIKLSSKGLVEKERIGRTNRLHYKK